MFLFGLKYHSIAPETRYIATSMINDAIMAEGLALFVIRATKSDYVQILEWLARHHINANFKTWRTCNNNARLNRFTQGIDK